MTFTITFEDAWHVLEYLLAFMIGFFVGVVWLINSLDGRR